MIDYTNRCIVQPSAGLLISSNDMVKRERESLRY